MEMVGILSMGAMREAYVPLPAPGAPRNMSLSVELLAVLNMRRITMLLGQSANSELQGALRITGAAHKKHPPLYKTPDWKGPVFSCVYSNKKGLYSSHEPSRHPAQTRLPTKMTISGTQRVWPMSIALSVAVAAVCISMQLSMIITIASIALAAYLPSYVDGAEYTGERFWPRFAEFMRERAVFPHTIEHEEPLDATKQYIYCSHPHGLLSAHHGNMLAGSTTPCTMSIVAM